MPQLTAAMVLQEARSCIGTPFMHQGRLKGLALDCVGFGVVVARNLDIPITDVIGYGTDPANGALEAALDFQESIVQVTDGSLHDADILIMRWKSDPRHVAFYGEGNIIHALLDVGIVCEHGFTDEWKARVVRTYRFKDLA